MTFGYSTAPLVERPRVLALYTPKLLTILREGYDLPAFRADVVAGLTVAIVALPLSMAIAIASGVGPERGLYTAIVGGFLVSLLGGSRFQGGRSRRSVHRAGGGVRRAPRRRACRAGDGDGRHLPGRRRCAASRQLHQVPHIP